MAPGPSRRTQLVLIASVHSSKLSRVSRDANLLFYQLLLVSDDAGRFSGSAFKVGAACMGARMERGEVTQELVSAWIRELENVGLVERYTGADGDRYLVILGLHRPVRKDRSPVLVWPEPGHGRQLADNASQPADNCTSYPTPTPTPPPPPERARARASGSSTSESASQIRQPQDPPEPILPEDPERRLARLEGERLKVCAQEAVLAYRSRCERLGEAPDERAVDVIREYLVEHLSRGSTRTELRRVLPQSAKGWHDLLQDVLQDPPGYADALVSLRAEGGAKLSNHYAKAQKRG